MASVRKGAATQPWSRSGNEMYGVRWWVEGDIKGFFDHVSHDTLITILSKRITDKRFLHLIGQFLRAGYIEDWRYHQTYSGVPHMTHPEFLGNPSSRKKMGNGETEG